MVLGPGKKSEIRLKSEDFDACPYKSVKVKNRKCPEKDGPMH